MLKLSQHLINLWVGRINELISTSNKPEGWQECGAISTSNKPEGWQECGAISTCNKLVSSVECETISK